MQSFLFELLHQSDNVKKETLPPIPLSLIQLYSMSTLKAAHKFGISPQGEITDLSKNHQEESHQKNDERRESNGLPKRKEDDRPNHGTSLDLFGDGYPGLM